MSDSENTLSIEKEAKTTKPRATKKKAAEAVEAAPEVAAEAPAKAKPAKKAVKTAVKKAAKKAEVTGPEPVAVEAQEPVAELEKPAAKKARKATKTEEDEPTVAESFGEVAADEAEETPAFKGPEPKLERLQKILAKAGISSRRKAEELILGGQVQINGKVVTELGTKADPSRDHIRVDGKLLAGPDRIRYFVLNKPKGFVTTVSDPEGRPTVMQFFATERERLYPVGRLDYLSEGLLLVTNDGDLANKLTKAASGVEKTYLVKVAGQPTEDMIDVLRAGVVIEKGRPGTNSGRVRTAPAQIRQVRQGDNPWYEVIIIEGRNRELRKMFEEIGHHVEKIRRIGYGPLILDLEPGKLRELEPEEVRDLHLAAAGKLKTRRRRGPQQAQLPTVAGKTVRYKKADGKPGYEPRGAVRERPAVRPEFQVESPADPRPEFKRIPKSEFHDGDKPAYKAAFKPGIKTDRKPAFKSASRPEFRAQGKADFKGDYKPRPKPSFRAEGKPAFRPEGKPEFRPEAGTGFKPAARFSSRPAGRPEFGGRSAVPTRARRPEPPVTELVLPPRKNRPELDDDATPQKGEFNPDYKPGFRTGGKPGGDRTGRPAPGSEFRPGGRPRGGPRAERHAFPLAQDDDYVPTKTPGFKVEPVEDKPRSGGFDRPRSGGFDRSGGGKSFRPRPEGGRPEGGRSGGFAGGSKPFRPVGDRPPTGDRPFRPRTEGSKPAGKSFRPREDAPAGEGRTFNRNAGRPAGGPKSFGDRPRSSGSAGSVDRPFRPAGRPAGRPTGDDRPREFRPSAPKKFSGAKPAAGSTRSSAPRKAGSDGEPRIKERWRNSFTGKNKGRPKPKPKGE